MHPVSASMSDDADTTPTVAIVVGEVSGDLLGAGLMEALQRARPDLRFVGIGGPRMLALGCHGIVSMERISLMGFDELFDKVLDILRIRRNLARRFLTLRPALFIGIDAPDFNLPLERRLRRAGITTVHYVSPTVWAWRGYRIRKIRRAVDHMLTLFPFEADYYRRQGVPVTFVGHPLADQIPDTVDRDAQRSALGLRREGRIVALLPGSRLSELRRLARVFVRTAQWLHARDPWLHFVAPFVNGETRAYFEHALAVEGAQALPVTLVDGQARAAMAAADVVLVASGTAALEAALLRRPMVVAYRVSAWSYPLLKLIVSVRAFSMPNHLAGFRLVPEFIQRDAAPEKLGPALEHYLNDPAAVATIEATFARIHGALRSDASARAAAVVLQLLPGRPAHVA